MKRLNDLLSGKEKIKVDEVNANTINTQKLIWENSDFSIIILDNSLNIYNALSEMDWFFNEDGSFESSEINSNVIHIEEQLSLPSYTTALRPTSQDEGSVIYDSTLKKCILYNGTAWVNLDGTSLA